MGSPNNPYSVEQNVSLYFDSALSKEDEIQLIQKIGSDPQCCEIFQKEKSARDFLKNNLKRSCCSKDMIKNIRSIYDSNNH